jgi:hypothetical protein
MMMTPRPLNALFLCTHDPARSVLAEALLNQIGRGRCKAYNALDRLALQERLDEIGRLRQKGE